MDDLALLHQYASSRDTDAFAALVKRYAGLVYGACLRVTGNTHDAEDMSQDCFMELARDAGKINSPLATWLYLRATSRAANSLRNASTRRRHEEMAAQRKDTSAAPSWSDVAPHFDQALAGLKEELRTPILLHYFQGQKQSDIADKLGLNQSTVSRRIEKGIDEIRGKLKKAGVIATAGVLGALLAENAAIAAPASLMITLSKMAIAGVGAGRASVGAASASVAHGVFLSTTAAKVAVAAVATVVAIVGIVSYVRLSESVPQPSLPNRTAMESGMGKGMVGKVKSDGNNVWIEGVGRLRFGEDRDNQFIAALTVAMQAMGEDVTYEYLMGVSGAAFRLHFWMPEWCPSSTALLGGFDHSIPVMKALGYTAHTIKRDVDDAEVRRTVIESIERGQPVIAQNLMGNGRYGVIAGYQQEGDSFLCRTYDDVTEDYSLSVGRPWLFFIIGNKQQIPDRRESIVKSLEIALELAHTRAYERDGKEQASGFAAYEKWTSDLLSDTLFAGKREEDLDYMAHTNAFCYLCLTDARGAASRYLESVVGDFRQSSAGHLLKAADLFETIHRKLKEGKTYAPTPWQTSECSLWAHDEKMRHNEAAVLRKAMDLEKDAMAEIEKALAKTSRKVVMLDDVPPGRGDSNSFARGLEIALNYIGTPASYETIMGDTGQAFIVQAEEGGPIVGSSVDVGWWPLAAWGLKMRLDFLSEVVGRQIREVRGSVKDYLVDQATHYEDRLASEVETSITAGRPVLAEHVQCFVVAGYDEGTPPLLGDCPLSNKKMKGRMNDYPWGLITFGEKAERLDRRHADLEALNHAVALGRDDVEMAVPVFLPEWNEARGFTGQRAFALWCKALRDTEHLGQARYHTNMCLHLSINRRSAIAYLRAMAERHPIEMGQHLRSAADIYEQVIAKLGGADTSNAAMISAEGREDLAALVEQIALLERSAIDEIDRAIDVAGE